MKYRRFLTILLSLLLFLSAISSVALATSSTAESPTQAGDSADPDGAGEDDASGDTHIRQIDTYDPQAGFQVVDAFQVAGSAALLYEQNSDTLLFTQNPDAKVYPASLTKLMTSLIAVENGDLNAQVTVSSNAINSVSARTGDLAAGETLSLHDLLCCILISSSNEGSNAAAEYIAGSIADFVAMMNAKASELGCTGTHFANPHGLHDEDHYTTARDLLLITKAVLANDTLREIVFSTSYEMPATNLQAPRTLYTTNYMTSTDQSYKYYYSLARGVKTGYTSSAGRCLIVTAEKNGMDLLAIVMGCETTEEENGEYVLHSFPEAKALFEYGFDHFEFVTVLSPMVPVAEVGVSGGSSSSVVVAPVTECSVALPKGYDPNDVTMQVTLQNGDTVQAPVEAGAVIGSISVSYRGKLMRTSEVAPITDVDVGNATFHSESAVDESEKPEAAAGGKHSVWVILLIVSGLLLAFYIFSYFYHNLTKKKSPSSTRKPRKQANKRPGSKAGSRSNARGGQRIRKG